jgi:putative addiction module killer protein
MEPRGRQVLIYTDARGRRPFEEWFGRLKDIKAQAIVGARLTRLEGGNFGDCRSLGGGLFELRIFHGPGYRIYFAETNDDLIVLLCGGSKATQQRDIARARGYGKEGLSAR